MDQTYHWKDPAYLAIYEALLKTCDYLYPEILTPDKDVSDIPEAVEFTFGRLSQEEQNLLLQHFVERKPYRIMSNEMGVSYAVVTHRVKNALRNMPRYDGSLYLQHGYCRGQEVAAEQAAEYKANVENFVQNTIYCIPFKGVQPWRELLSIGIETLDQLDTWLQDPNGVRLSGIGPKKKALIRDAYLQYLADEARTDIMQAPLTTIMRLATERALLGAEKLAKMGIVNMNDLNAARAEGRLVPSTFLPLPYIQAIEYYARPWLS